MTDPFFLSASYQPSDYIREQEAAGKTMPARPGLFGSEGFTFGDFLDIINPLQHIPVVATIYRAVTGDTIKPGARIAGDTLFGGPIGLVTGVADAMVQESTGKDIGEQAMAMVGIDIGPDHQGQPSQPETGIADAGKSEPQPQPGAGGASVEAQAAQASVQQATVQQAAARPAAMPSQPQPDSKRADLKMTVGTAPGPVPGQPKLRWAGAASEPKQKEVGADDAVAADSYDGQRMAQELAEQQAASRRAIEQMLASHQVEAAQNVQAPQGPAAVPAAAPSPQKGQTDPSAIISAMAHAAQPGARSISAGTAAAPQVGADGRLWFPAFPKGGAMPARAVGAQPVGQQAVSTKFGSAKASLPPPPTVAAPVVSPVAVAASADGSIPSAAVDDWAERAAAGYQKYFDMQQQTDRTRALDMMYH